MVKVFYNIVYDSDCLFDIFLVCTEHIEAEGLLSELEWMSEMTEDEYNELTPRTRHELDHIRLHLNMQRLKRYFISSLRLLFSSWIIVIYLLCMCFLLLVVFHAYKLYIPCHIYTYL